MLLEAESQPLPEPTEPKALAEMEQPELTAKTLAVEQLALKQREPQPLAEEATPTLQTLHRPRQQEPPK
jgi:hypothetical protein